MRGEERELGPLDRMSHAGPSRDSRTNLPIVSTAVGDVEARLSGVSGCSVCPDGDPGRMAAALTTVLHRRERTNGRSTVIDLDENVLTRRTIEIYERAVSNGSRHRSHHGALLASLTNPDRKG